MTRTQGIMIRLILAGLLAILAVTQAQAQQQQQQQAKGTSGTGFTQGTIYFEPRGSAYGTSNNQVGFIGTYGAGLGYFMFNNFALELEGLGYAVNQNRVIGVLNRDYPAAGIGAGVNGRWHFVATNQATLFIGAGLGGLWADRPVPYDGNQNTMTENAEIGATLALSSMLQVKLGAKYLHIGEFSSRGVNAFGGTLGLNVSF